MHIGARIWRYGCAVAVSIMAVTACGDVGVDYPRRFDVLIPSTWLLDSESGKISSSGCTSTGCGELDRSYELRSDVAVASTELAVHLQQQGCQVAKGGNGLTAECPDVHLSVSFTTKTVTIAMTRQSVTPTHGS